jgi:hypothetical protein
MRSERRRSTHLLGEWRNRNFPNHISRRKGILMPAHSSLPVLPKRMTNTKYSIFFCKDSIHMVLFISPNEILKIVFKTVKLIIRDRYFSKECHIVGKGKAIQNKYRYGSKLWAYSRMLRQR